MSGNIEATGAKPANDDAKPAAPEKPKPPTPEQLEAATKQLDHYVDTVLGTAFRGMNVSLPSIPGEVLLRSIARCTGKLVAQSIAMGPLQEVLKARRSIRDEYDKGVHSVEIIEPKAPPKSMVKEPVA